MKLLIANKNYSSWSLRGWLMLRGFDLDFDEIQLTLFTDDFYTQIAKYSGAAQVPVLVDGDVSVWDSLAICEYISERYLDGKGWPTEMSDRAHARAIAAEMHSGFTALRQQMPMNIRAHRHITPSDNCLKNIARIDQIWSAQMQKFSDKGGWLFGEFSIADVMYAPVALRFLTYQTPLSSAAKRYQEKVINDRHIQRWIQESKNDSLIIDEDEAGITVFPSPSN